MPKSVNPTFREEIRETFSLLDRKTCSFFIPFWSGDVNLLMADIQIPTENCSFLFSQLL